MKIIKSVFVLILIFFIIGYAKGLIKMIVTINIFEPSVVSFISGFLVFIPLWFVWMKKAHFFSTFEHELTHLLVGLIFLKKPESFKVTEREGGSVYLHGHNFLIALAPYFLPTFSILFLPMYYIINSDFHIFFFIILGFLTSYHFFSTKQDLHYKQPDIIRSGKIFSTFFLVFANIFFCGFIIAFIIGKFNRSWVFIKMGFIQSVNFFELIKTIRF